MEDCRVSLLECIGAHAGTTEISIYQHRLEGV